MMMGLVAYLQGKREVKLRDRTIERLENVLDELCSYKKSVDFNAKKYEQKIHTFRKRGEHYIEEGKVRPAQKIAAYIASMKKELSAYQVLSDSLEEAIVEVGIHLDKLKTQKDAGAIREVVGNLTQIKGYLDKLNGLSIASDATKLSVKLQGIINELMETREKATGIAEYTEVAPILDEDAQKEYEIMLKNVELRKKTAQKGSEDIEALRRKLQEGAA